MEDDERNNVTHSYNRKIAMGIIALAKQEFYKMFCELKATGYRDQEQKNGYK